MRTYEKYKDSGISWLGKVPENWEVCKVKHHYKLLTGFTPATKVAEFYDTNNGHTWITIADLKGKVVTDSTNKISDFYLNEYHQEKVKEGSLLYSFKLSVGQVAFAGKDLYTNEAIAAFQNSDKVNLKFFFYAAPLFIIHNSNINIYGAHILNQDLIKNAYTVFPPLPEQEAIANYLDKKTAEIDKIIAEREKKIELLNELKSSIISRAVTKGINPHAKMKDSGIDWIGVIPEGWDVCHLKAVFKLKTGTTPKFFEEDKSINKVDWYTPGDFNEDFILGNSKRKLDKETFETNNFDYFPANSILLVGIGTAGKVACTSKKCYSNQQITALLPNRNLNSLYIMLYLRGISDYLLKTAPYTTLPILSNAYMSRVNILLPPLEEQNNIVQHVLSKTRKMEHDINLIQSEITLLREYKQSLISEVVTGKRKVID